MKNEKFASRLGLILAAAAGSVGLGNIWKFPYMVGANGGAAFLLVYIVCVIIFGLPLMMTEFMIGKTSEGSIHSAYQRLSNSKRWQWIPALTFISTTFITGLYLVIVGWCIGYFCMSITGSINQVVDAATAETVFQSFSTSLWKVITCTVVAIGLSIVILWAGVNKGIERLCKILMPILFALLLILVVRVAFLDGAGRGYAFLFKPDWKCLTPKVILGALGQCFYSLSIGMGALITYGAYMAKDTKVNRVAAQVVGLDTLAAIIAGCAIFPAVFAFNFCPEQGPKLVFNVIPLVFGQMPAGQVFSLLFFALLIIAAVTSSASLFEVLVAALMDATSQWKRPISRHKGLVICGLACFGVALACALSGGAFDWIDRLTSTCTLPIIALGTTLFVGWFVVDKQLEFKPFTRFLIRYFIPLIILLIFFNGIGVL